jgi:hypothetical protein
MSRDLRKSGVVGLLLLGLLHAWFGHDLFHGHHHGHHQDPAQAAHTTAVHRSDNGPIAKIAPVALLITLCDFALPPLSQHTEVCVDFEVVDSIEPQFLERPQSQRAPPLPFSFA